MNIFLTLQFLTINSPILMTALEANAIINYMIIVKLSGLSIIMQADMATSECNLVLSTKAICYELKSS